MKALFDQLSRQCSKSATLRYSTSFSLSIRFLAADLRRHVYNLYGFVRIADEIVDSFQGYNQVELFRDFKNDTYKALDRSISSNPILNAFQETVRKYGIERELIDTFLSSMEMDLCKHRYSQEELDRYILGSAEVVGLMCLRIFTRGDQDLYEKLKGPAMQLGSAFQKVNFLRDMQADYEGLGRSYFPNVQFETFSQEGKAEIEESIAIDFKAGFEGIRRLPKDSRFGVYLAYRYYYRLFLKIKKTCPTVIATSRIRIPDPIKYKIFFTSLVRHQSNLI
ncbi:MAG: phytoene/squalene synthase family protein [Bacteroidota bacterium]